MNPEIGRAKGECAEIRTTENPAVVAEPEQMREASSGVASGSLQPDASGRMAIGDLDAAIRRAVEHDQWELAMVLAAELKARRLVDAGVPSLEDRRAKRR